MINESIKTRFTKIHDHELRHNAFLILLTYICMDQIACVKDRGTAGALTALWSIWILNKKVGLHKETQQKLLLECHGSLKSKKFQKSYDGPFQ